MSGSPRGGHGSPARRKPAARPPTRTIEAAITEGPFEGWQATARADFPARLLVDLQSGDLGRIVAVLDAIVLDHNLPDEAGKLATSMGEVDPYDGLLAIAGAIFDGLGKLPNR